MLTDDPIYMDLALTESETEALVDLGFILDHIDEESDVVIEQLKKMWGRLKAITDEAQTAGGESYRCNICGLEF